MAFEATRRWIKDRMVRDSSITQHPKKVLAKFEASIADMPVGNRKVAVDYMKAYANLYYVERHNQDIPAKIAKRMNELEARANKMDIVDRSHEVVSKYGTPDQALVKLTTEARRGRRSHFEIGQEAGQEQSHNQSHRAELKHEKGKGKPVAQEQSLGVGM